MIDVANLVIRADSRQVRSAEKDVKGLGSTSKTTTGLLKGVGVALASVGAVSFIQGIVRTRVEFENMRSSLITVTGSAKNAENAFARIKEFAATTPFSVKQATRAFIQLKALGLDPSEAAMRSYGNTASAMGFDLNQMVEAVADAATGEFERLKQFGIKAKSEGDRVSFIFQGITTTVGKNAKEIEAFLRRIGDVEFANATERQAATLGGALSNLSDAFDQFKDNLGASIDGPISEVARYFAEVLPESAGTVIKAIKALAVVITARLIASLTASTAAFVLAQAQNIRYQATLATMAGNSRLAAIGITAMGAAARVAGGFMALLGGPVGVITIAAAAIFSFRKELGIVPKSVDDARLGLDRLTQSIEKMTAAQASFELLSVNKDLKDAMQEANNLSGSVSFLQDQLDARPNNEFLKEAILAQSAAFDTALQKANTYKQTIQELNNVVAGRPNTPATPTQPVVPVASTISDDLVEMTGPMSEWIELQREAVRVYESTRTPLENLKSSLEKYDLLLSKNRITQDTRDRAVKAAQDDFVILGNKVNETEDNFKSLTRAVDGWGASFADAMVSSTGSFSDFAKNMITQMQKIAIQQASQPIFDAFSGAIKSVGSDLFAAFIPSADGGGFTGSGSRSGGVDGKGGFPAILHPQETVIDHTKGQSGGNVSVMVNVDASRSDTSGDQEGANLGKMIGSAVRSVLIQERRPGGLLT
jgi:hypothetical protein